MGKLKLVDEATMPSISAGQPFVAVPAALWAALNASAGINLAAVDSTTMDEEDWDDMALLLATRYLDAVEGEPAEITEMIDRKGLHPIAAWRRHRGLTQAALAVEVGVSQDHISRVERGLDRPSVELLVRLRDTLRSGTLDALLPD